MATQDLRFRLLGEDAGASRALSKVQQQAEGTHAAFGNLGRQLANLGGPFSIAQTAFDSLGSGLDHIREHGKSVGSVLVGVGAAATGAGVLLAQFGAQDQQAQAQLRSAVENTGASWSAFRGKVEDAVHSQERFGHTADDTQSALNNLTVALQDPNKALQEMSVVADLAAKRHMTLAEASTTLIKAQEGNARAFRDLGIVLDGNGTKTEQINRALDEMQKRLSGQASAAADTFSGRLQAMRAHAEDFLASLAKYAPALLAIGPLTTAAGAAFSFLARQKAANVAADALLVPAEEAVATAEGEAAAATTAASASRGAGLLAGGLRALPLVGVAATGALIANQVTQSGNRSGAAKLMTDATSGAAGLAAVEKDRAQVAALVAKAGADVGGAGKMLLGEMDAAIKAGKASGDAATKVSALGQASAKTASQIDTEIASLHKFSDAAIQSSATGDQFRKSLNDLGKSVDTSNHALQGGSDAAIANRDALRNLASQELAHIDALRAQGKSSDDVRAAAQKMSAQLETQATKVLGNKHAVDTFLASLGVLPGQIKTTLGDLSAVGQNVGMQLDAGLTLGIQQNAGKINLVTKQTIDGIVHTAHATAQLGSPSKRTQYIGEMLAQGLIVGFDSQRDSLLTHLTTAVDAAMHRLRDKVDGFQQAMAAKVKSARDALSAAVNTRDQYASGLTSNLMRSDNITGAIDSSTGAVGNIGDFLSASRDQMGALSGALGSLKTGGLSADLLQQIAEAGPAQGLALAQSILGGASGPISSLNATEAAIMKSATGIGSFTANDLYAGDIKTQQQTLKDQLAEQRQMNKLLALVVEKVSGDKTASQVLAELQSLKKSGVVLGL